MGICLRSADLVEKIAVLGGAGCHQRHVHLMAVLSNQVRVSFAILKNETFLSAAALVTHHAIGIEDRLNLALEADR